MNKIMILMMVVILALTGCVQSSAEVEVTDTSYATFFSEDIHELYIEISDENWSDILEDPLAEAFHEANIRLDGISIENVGLRTKGNSTLRSVANSDSDRYSFKIKIDKYLDQKLLGLDEFVINNMFSDASYMREYLSYQAMADNGANVPLCSFVNVYVNDELYGFYLLLEAVDDSFMNRVYGDNDGNLYRGDQGTTMEVSNEGYEENFEQKNGKDESKADIYGLLDVLNEMPAGEKGEIESVLDVASVLNYIAANTVLQSYDSYNGQFSQNFYFYNNDGVFTMIPWDYNMSFGTFGTKGMTAIAIDTPVNGKSMEEAPLISKLLAVDDYKAVYYDLVRDYIDYFSDFETKVSDLADQIRPYVEADPSRFTSMESFEINVTYQEDGEYEIGNMAGQGFRPPEGLNQGEMTGPKDRPARDEAGSKVVEGMNPPNDRDKDQREDKMMLGNDVSIINILQARIENIMNQLK